MKSSFFWKMFFGIASLFALSSCNVDDGDYYFYDTVAHGTIGNASPSSGDLFFFADNNQVNTNGLSFGNAVGYYNFYEGNRVISVQDNTGNTLASAQLSLSIGDFFTVFAVNDPENMELAVYEDVLEEPFRGHAGVRFINLSPDSGSIDVEDAGSDAVSALAYRDASQFINIPEGSHTFRFRSSSDDTVLYTKQINLAAGRIYTIYTKGLVYPSAGDNSAFSAEAIYNY